MIYQGSGDKGWQVDRPSRTGGLGLAEGRLTVLLEHGEGGLHVLLVGVGEHLPVVDGGGGATLGDPESDLRVGILQSLGQTRVCLDGLSAQLGRFPGSVAPNIDIVISQKGADLWHTALDLRLIDDALLFQLT